MGRGWLIVIKTCFCLFLHVQYSFWVWAICWLSIFFYIFLLDCFGGFGSWPLCLLFIEQMANVHLIVFGWNSYYMSVYSCICMNVYLCICTHVHLRISLCFWTEVSGGRHGGPVSTWLYLYGSSMMELIHECVFVHLHACVFAYLCFWTE